MGRYLSGENRPPNATLMSLRPEMGYFWPETELLRSETMIFDQWQGQKRLPCGPTPYIRAQSLHCSRQIHDSSDQECNLSAYVTLPPMRLFYRLTTPGQVYRHRDCSAMRRAMQRAVYTGEPGAGSRWRYGRRLAGQFPQNDSRTSGLKGTILACLGDNLRQDVANILWKGGCLQIKYFFPKLY